MEKETYSFSRLKTFNDCKHAYYLSYVMGNEKRENVYSYLGTITHEVLEELQQGKINNEIALQKLLDQISIAEFMGYEFPSDKIREDYIKCVSHSVENYDILDAESFEIEKRIEFEINGNKIVGYIDLLLYHSDGTVTVIDFKTSSKYSGKELIKNSNQLILYALGLEQEGLKIRGIAWYMLKYCEVQGKRKSKIIKRSELEQNQEYSPCIISYPYTQESKERCVEWVTSTINEIESMDVFDYWETRDFRGFNSFTCQWICSVGLNCAEFKNYIKNR